MRKILVIKTSSLGDIIHCFPAVSLLKSLNPDAQVDWLVNKSFADLVSMHPSVERVLIFDRERLGKLSSFLPTFKHLRNSLKKGEYDFAIDFQGLLRNSFFAWLSGAKNVVGFEKPKEALSRLFYDRAIPTGGAIHAVDRNLSLVKGIFGDGKDFGFHIQTNTEMREKVLGIFKGIGLKEGRRIVIVSPCARWESKMWPSDFFVSAIRRIEKDFPDIDFLLVGSSSDIEFCSKICSSGLKSTYNLAGMTTIRELFEIIRMGSAMLCVDSGPMHIAAALNIPVFALFGPTDPAKTGPYGENHTVFQSEDACIKCFKRYCGRSSVKCHEGIKPEVLAEAFKNKMVNLK